ncbi:hypothetical protein C8R43DRAFT_1236532 [Mycena crocata]|nr:hypothetical protein C8R43DRAFT_1236532 [Mycena crocata]
MRVLSGMSALIGYLSTRVQQAICLSASYSLMPCSPVAAFAHDIRVAQPGMKDFVEDWRSGYMGGDDC